MERENDKNEIARILRDHTQSPSAILQKHLEALYDGFNITMLGLHEERVRQFILGLKRDLETISPLAEENDDKWHPQDYSGRNAPKSTEEREKCDQYFRCKEPWPRCPAQCPECARPTAPSPQTEESDELPRGAVGLRNMVDRFIKSVMTNEAAYKKEIAHLRECQSRLSQTEAERDAIKGEKEVIIVEGEMDCLSCHESGVYHVISVPNGAGTGNLRLEYLDNCWPLLADKERIILATDGDAPGRRLREELARRLGVGRCYQVVYPDGCKDLNDVLKMHGPSKVQGILAAIQPWPIKGIHRMEDLYETVADWYENGYPAGAKSRIPGFDPLLTFAPGQLTTFTGIPGHGKDEFCNYLMTNLSRYENWLWGVFGFEETSPETVTKLAEKFTGKSFAWRKDPAHRMSVQEFEWAIAQIDNGFYFVATDEIETNIENILEIATQLVLQKGIKGLYLNPWNWIEHNRAAHQTETEYVSIVLGKIVKWAKKHLVHVFLVAHTTKITKDKDGKYMIPNLYSISGSANFFNKTFNGVCVYRNYENNITDVYVQKVKQSWLGQIGFSSYQFNTLTRQYEFLTSSVAEKMERSRPTLGPPEGRWSPIKEDD